MVGLAVGWGRLLSLMCDLGLDKGVQGQGSIGS